MKQKGGGREKRHGNRCNSRISEIERGGLEFQNRGRKEQYKEKRKHDVSRGEIGRREDASRARRDIRRSEEEEREDREGNFGIASSNANLFGYSWPIEA